MPPLFYEDPVLVQKTLHEHAARLACDTFQFAAEAIAIPLNGSEFARAARCYPIVFADDSTMSPLAVTGISERSNLFIDDDGQWSDTAYVPAYIRRYPFLPVMLPGSDTLMLAIDRPRLVERAGPSVGDDAANDPDRLFDGDKASPLAAQALAFCEHYHREHLLTAAFVAALDAEDLFAPRRANIQLPDQPQFHLDGFRMIDRAKLQALPDDRLADWFRKGWLDLVALADASQANWQALLNRNAARRIPATPNAAPARRRATRKRSDA